MKSRLYHSAWQPVIERNSIDENPPSQRWDWGDTVPGYWEGVLGGIALAAASYPFLVASAIALIAIVAQPASFLEHIYILVSGAAITCLFTTLFAAILSFFISLTFRAVFPGPRAIRSDYCVAGFFGGLTAFLAISLLVSPMFAAMASSDSPALGTMPIALVLVLMSTATICGQAGGLWGARNALRKVGLLAELIVEGSSPSFSIRFLIRLTTVISVLLALLKVIGFPLGGFLVGAAVWLPLQAATLWVLLRSSRNRIQHSLSKAELEGLGAITEA